VRAWVGVKSVRQEYGRAWVEAYTNKRERGMGGAIWAQDDGVESTRAGSESERFNEVVCNRVKGKNQILSGRMSMVKSKKRVCTRACPTTFSPCDGDVKK
jgi:hypothetical protein